jgi:hypothetical protein
METEVFFHEEKNMNGYLVCNKITHQDEIKSINKNPLSFTSEPSSSK